MSERIEYVVGFLFDDTWEWVVLIQKEKGPEHLRGKWNGVGGKIERFEKSSDAMEREFLEEAGLTIPADQWTYFCDYVGKGFVIDFYFANVSYEILTQAKTMEIETVRHFNIDELPFSLMENLNWLLPLAKGANILHLPIVIYEEEYYE